MASKRILSILLLVLIIVSSVELFKSKKGKNYNQKKHINKMMDISKECKVKKCNRLINEKSPYLLQHSHNPVNWFAWSDEAFEKAQKEDKLIFLSIGYSTCHWCHVMEKESFEDEEVAKILNENYVSIKVDREERPDIDSIYMSICQALTGSGGWPLTIIITPQKKPVYAGTYFPKKSSLGRPGLMELLPQIAKLWKDNKQKLMYNANEITQKVKEYLEENKTGGLTQQIDKSIFDNAFNYLKNRYDSLNGGFGSAPKFSTPHVLSYLLRYWYNTNKQESLEMVENSLKKMRMGGIYDHIGFGFHRYSTDEKWLVPHFEKMLYDQAMQTIAYTEAYLATGKKLYREIAEEILTYVLRDMVSPDGGFYSAEDADSEGLEGKFYIWKYDEIMKILDKDECNFISEVYNIKKEGNIDTQLHGHNEAVNIFYLSENPDETAKKLKLKQEEFYKKLEEIRKKLFDIREKRIHPYKDDKILVDWNGLMIVALSKAYRHFNEPKYKEAAIKATEFILSNMIDKNRGLLHRYREGQADILGFLNDYVFFTWGLLELYQSTYQLKYLKEAIRLMDFTIEHFLDDKDGGFYLSSDLSEKLIIRNKELYDGAMPSGNSVVLLNLLQIWHITSNQKYKEIAEQLIKVFSNDVLNYPIGYAQFLIGLDFLLNVSYQIVIVTDKYTDKGNNILNRLNALFLPNKVVLLKTFENEKELIAIAPYTKEQAMLNGKPTIYLCKDFVCNLPTNDIESALSGIIKK